LKKINTLLNIMSPEGICKILKDKLTRECFRRATTEFFIIWENKKF